LRIQVAVAAEREDSSTESILQSGARLLDESKRLLFDLDAIARGGEPDAIAPER
jgi:hypothetical protein